ncbi:MAG TPA: hypothetical protein VL307_16355 [Chitinophagaceae bacterium]|nr:hypothetical protein [Chitinophagaceae bacterium]
MKNTEYRNLLPADFAPNSRVWIYQSNRLFTLSEAIHIEDILKEFTASWLSHGQPVKGWANLFFGRFIVLMADETATGVSGCSTDSSVRLIRELESAFSVALFDRHLLAFLVKDDIQVLPLSQLQYAFDNQFLTPDTIYFNNLVQTREELESKWMVPIKDSWLTTRLSLEQPGLK